MRNSNIHALASRLNNMKNPIHIGPSLGKVVKVTPMTLSIAGGSVLLTEGEELIVCERLKDKTYKCEIAITDGTLSGSISISELSETVEGNATHGEVSGAFSGTLTGSSTGTAGLTGMEAEQEGEITIKPEIAVDDMILVIPMEGEQIWVAVERIGGDSI